MNRHRNGNDLRVHVPMNRPFKEAKRALLDVFERRYITDLMREHRGNLSAASRASNLSRRHLRDLMRRYGLYRGPNQAYPGSAPVTAEGVTAEQSAENRSAVMPPGAVRIMVM